ncbi:MAG: UDP-glucose/GDP-mannose dehydrogenase family protein [Magnetococcales bacterium]|nr:UDP-glucose/GDP-mannose dehydrogenase family protein [Magnetococcales bacterium]
MNTVVLGMWHLGSVTAAAMAEAGHRTVGLDPDPQVIEALREGRPPLYEPFLAETIVREQAGGRLSFTTDPAVIAGADLLWVAIDTPVDEADRAEVGVVEAAIHACFDLLKENSIVLVSSQLPVGSIARLERAFALRSGGRRVGFASWPENLRLGEALARFRKADRIVLGLREPWVRKRLEPIARDFSREVLVMGVESAEMSKHALNAYLATCIAFTNEVASLCEVSGADAREVERALRSDPRVGPKAYVRAGGPFAGGTLARDLGYLSALGEDRGVAVPLLRAVPVSNAAHHHWSRRRLLEMLGNLDGRPIAVLGLTYKIDTDTLRRSAAIELIHWLVAQGARVSAFDPRVRTLPEALAPVVTLAASWEGACQGAEAVIVTQGRPEFEEMTPALLREIMRRPLVLDPERAVESTLGAVPGNESGEIAYVTVGRP